MLALSVEIMVALFTFVCLRAGSSNGDGVEPSNFGDQFDQTTTPVDTTPTAYDEVDAAGQTGGKSINLCNPETESKASFYF